MATTTYAVLGQTIGTPALQALYTAGASEQAVISTITIANRGTVADIAYDASCPGNDTIALTLGITLNGNDVVSVYSGTTNLTFNAFGAEIN